MFPRVGIYLDSNAGVPLSPAALGALQSFLGAGAFPFLPNPSSPHFYGRLAKKTLSQARAQVALSLGLEESQRDQVIFTSSGSESNQMVIRSVIETHLNQGIRPHWMTTALEHDSNLQMVEWVEERGGQVSILPSDADGIPIFDDLERLTRKETVLLSIIWVNNETGVITPLQKLKEWAVRHPQVLVHLDGAQAWGKLPIHFSELPVHFLSLSGYKIGALSGIGVLGIASAKKGVQPLIFGTQEKNRRGGTENLLGAISLGAAASALDPLRWAQKVEPLRNLLEEKIHQTIPGTSVNGKNSKRIANTLNLSFSGIADGQGLIMALDQLGYHVSAGSACSSGISSPSHVLSAMGLSPALAKASIRISLSEDSNLEDLQSLVGHLAQVVFRMRAANSATSN